MFNQTYMILKFLTSSHILWSEKEGAIGGGIMKCNISEQARLIDYPIPLAIFFSFRGIFTSLGGALGMPTPFSGSLWQWRT